jgi:4-amino-4-deoxy-L-arabinose transferase-like glycosyltransferase
MTTDAELARGGARWPAAVLLGAVALYLVLGTRHLDTVPPVHEDEPWLASVGFRLAEEGIFGSDLSAGLYGLERRTYELPPLHSLFLAPVFEIFGVGLVQARAETVAWGLVVLLLTFELGRRLHSAEVGALAAALLVSLRWSSAGRYQATGIVFLDMARIARYDMEVPAFGLAALIAWTIATRPRAGSGGAGWFALAGLLVGAATLSQPNGLFLLPCLFLLALWQRAGARTLVVTASGFALPAALYALYVAADPAAFLAQTRSFAPRFRLLDASWYLDNLLREPARYTQALGAEGWSDWIRPGLLALAIGLPLALVQLARQARPAPWARRAAPGGGAHPLGPGARVLLVTVIVFPILLALLVTLKPVFYLVAVAPLFALTLAWAARELWRRSAAHELWRRSAAHELWCRSAVPRRRAVRAFLVLAAVAIGAEAASRIAAFERRAATTTPYPELVARLRDELDGAERVLILHHYWFGLEDLEARSWRVPILLAGRGADREQRLRQALDDLAPQAVVVDVRMREQFARQPWIERTAMSWLEERGLREVVRVDDATYGVFEVLRAPAPAASP